MDGTQDCTRQEPARLASSTPQNGHGDDSRVEHGVAFVFSTGRVTSWAVWIVYKNRPLSRENKYYISRVVSAGGPSHLLESNTEAIRSIGWGSQRTAGWAGRTSVLRTAVQARMSIPGLASPNRSVLVRRACGGVSVGAMTRQAAIDGHEVVADAGPLRPRPTDDLDPPFTLHALAEVRRGRRSFGANAVWWLPQDGGLQP